MSLWYLPYFHSTVNVWILEKERKWSRYCVSQLFHRRLLVSVWGNTHSCHWRILSLTVEFNTPFCTEEQLISPTISQQVNQGIVFLSRYPNRVYILYIPLSIRWFYHAFTAITQISQIKLVIIYKAALLITENRSVVFFTLWVIKETVHWADVTKPKLNFAYASTLHWCKLFLRLFKYIVSFFSAGNIIRVALCFLCCQLDFDIHLIYWRQKCILVFSITWDIKC